jgi:uncharacterized protein YdhG (YjbR/CyaY superfamily)
MKKSKPTTVDEYIADAPSAVKPNLRELRALIRKTAPDAEERISYGMPYYHHRGRLAYFSYWTSHIGLYIPTPVLAEHKSELSEYETSSATVPFPLDKKLPAPLIKKLLRARMAKNKSLPGARKTKSRH